MNEKTKSRVDPREVAICTIHGNSKNYEGTFAEEFAWPRIQIEHLRKHTPSGYTVYGYGNELLPSHEDFLRSCPEVEYIPGKDVPRGHAVHVWPLRNWLTRVAIKRHRYIVHLDSDAFPVHDDWLRCLSLLSEESPVVAVQRLENGDTHSDRCFLAFTRDEFRRHAFDFSSVGVVDAGGGISKELEESGYRWTALTRSNAFDYHPLISGIYADLIYHHAAGSRPPRFRMNQAIRSSRLKRLTTFRREQRRHRLLMQKLFEDPHLFLRQLRGLEAPFDLEAELGIVARALRGWHLPAT